MIHTAITSHRPWGSRFARQHPRAYLGLHVAVGLVLSIAFALFFRALTDTLLQRGPLLRVDHALAGWVDGHNTETGEQVANVVSWFGEPILNVILVGVGVWYLGRRRWLHVALLAAAGAGGALLNKLLKDRFQRPRPVYAAEFHVGLNSFPSGHAMGACIGYGVLAYFAAQHVADPARRRLVYIAAALAILTIGAARVYLDVHFLSDVIGGFAAGAMWLFVCFTGFFFVRRLRTTE